MRPRMLDLQPSQLERKDKNIGFDGYIDNLILRIYQNISGSISGYFDTKYQLMKIDKKKIIKMLEK